MAPTDAVETLVERPERPIVDLRATLGRGDGFAAVLERAGVAAAEAGHIAAMVGGVVPLADIRPGTVMDMRLGRRPNRTVARPLENLTFRARFDLRVELARVAGALTLTRIPIAVDDTPLRSRAWSAPASIARPAPPACRRARSRPISARSTPSSACPPGSIQTTGSTSSSSIAAPRPAKPRPGSCSMPGSSGRAAAISR